MARNPVREWGVIRFGTSGWRGVLGEEVTLPRLRRLVRAAATWLGDGSEATAVLVGHDTRFASRALAEMSCDVLRECGLAPSLVRGAVPTPVLTHAVRRRRVAGGLMLTASHNPPAYHGLKLFGPDGGAIDDAAARAIESRLGGAGDGPASAPGRRVRGVDLTGAYVRDLGRLLDGESLARARVGVVHDAMHGAGAGILDRVLRERGGRIVNVRAAPDPHFGGGAPDPVAARLGPLFDAVGARRGRWLGLATDGDADRLAVVLPGGRLLSETEIVALLVDHLARTRRLRRGVAVSLATGTLVDRVASAHGLAVHRRAIGFKHLAGSLRAGEVDVAGDESGGFAWSAMGIDKDGLLAGALFCEIAAAERRGVPGRLDALLAEYGTSACGRRAVVASPDHERGLEGLATSPAARVDGAAVEAVTRDDGVHWRLADGFVMWRRSGTEPVVRVYAEARDERALRRRLVLGERLLLAAGAGRGGSG